MTLSADSNDASRPLAAAAPAGGSRGSQSWTATARATSDETSTDPDATTGAGGELRVADESVPLCVDLDGTLVQTDMLFESLLSLIKQQPLCVLLIPFWLLQGKAQLKSEIASRVNLAGGRFPLHEEVLAFVRAERQRRRTVLVTGSHQSLADVVAEQTDAFDEVQGSSETVNLTRHNKRAWLVERFGEGGFDYIGNDRDDLDVWPAGRQALVVSPPGGIADTEGQSFSRVFSAHKPGRRDFMSLMRVHQWSKNALILVPYFLDQRFNDGQATVAILLAFLAMSLLASMTYIFNDMLDLQSDRQNPTKSRRALPSGRVALVTGFRVMAVLGAGVLLICLFLPLAFNLALAAYLVLTLAYSFFLKQHAIIDVGMIAGLHTLRVIAGTLAISAQFSFWLLAFSMFFFFSLALAKRVAELINLQKAGRETTLGRDYQVSDVPVLLASGVSTGYLSVLVVALYINSEKVQLIYGTPMMLWLVCPILMYWVGRIWMKTARGLMHEDPIVFGIRDRISRLTFGLLTAVVVLAMVVR